MTRIRLLALISTFIAIAVTVLLWFWSRPARVRMHEAALLRLYATLPREVRLKAAASLSPAPAIRDEIEQFQREPRATLSDNAIRYLQAVIDRTLAPVPIRNGVLESVVPQPPNENAPVLTLDQQKRILDVSKSVGRITGGPASAFVLAGTGFVVQRGPQTALIATNCHVLLADPISLTRKPEGGGTPVVADLNLRIDFSEGPKQEGARAFPITKILACSETAGLDVALLEASTQSVSPGGEFPKALTRRETPLQKDWQHGERQLIGIIGYPNLRAARNGDKYSELFTRYSPDKYAKFYSPGAITSVESKTAVDYLLHVASTMVGQSGSPVIEIGGRGESVVTGIDACCGRPLGPLPGPAPVLNCASRLVSEPRNLSIAMWSAVADPRLRQEIGPAN
jgi:hypothetical protein